MYTKIHNSMIFSPILELALMIPNEMSILFKYAHEKKTTFGRNVSSKFCIHILTISFYGNFYYANLHQTQNGVLIILKQKHSHDKCARQTKTKSLFKPRARYQI